MTRGASPATLARGRARQKQVAAENQAKVDKLAAKLIADLGPTANELAIIHMGNVAYWQVRSTYLESIGRNSDAAREKLYQALKAAGIKPDKPAPAPKKTIAERLAERGYAAPEVTS